MCVTCHVGGGLTAGTVAALGGGGLGFELVVETVVVVVFGCGTRTNRAVTSLTPATPVTVHERFVPAEAQRPPQPANREPAAGFAVRVTRSPSRGNGNTQDEEQELRLGGFVAVSNANTPLPVPINRILAVSPAAADETAANTRPSKMPEQTTRPLCRTKTR
jgi:hypothetical protein